MRKAPLLAALIAVASLVMIDRTTLGLASDRARALVARATGAPLPPPPPAAPALVHIEPKVELEDVLGAPPSSTSATGAVPEEPQEMDEDWGELLPSDDEGSRAGDPASPADPSVDPNAPSDERDAPVEDAGDDDTTDTEPAPVGPPLLVSIARETWVYAEPRWKSRRVGYLRAGAAVARSAEPVSRQSCRRGWYRVQPAGYVCLNKRATLDPEHPVAVLSARRPDLGGLPYPYVMSRFPTPPLYARLPSEAQQKHVEPERHYHLRKHQQLMKDPDFVALPAPEQVPPLLADGALIPPLGGELRGKNTVLLRHARVRSGFALLGTYERDGRQFGLTTEMAALPLDRTRVVEPSRFRGVVLSDELTLPVAIVRSKFARRYEQHEASGALAAVGQLTPRAVLGLTGEQRKHGEHYFLEARDGTWMRSDQVVRIDSFTKAPKWAQQGKKWIDVSILRQSLVAYEGERPVYATLVSTGADGIQDHQKSHATIQGTFLIHTKHLTVTMDGDERGDEFDLRDVPYVQYFTEGYALHGAYWHDDFGTPRSHGCVNLAPLDAAWLFRWTEPVVPKGWHAALSLKNGTIVYIHP